MNINLLLSLVVGKIILQMSRFFKIGGGSAAPGYYALKIYPKLVSELVKFIPQTIIITGTNGKTTTSRMLAQFATDAGFKVIRNSTGSNLERGIASTLISRSHFPRGEIDVDLAIWELDEAAFNSVVPKLKPDMIVFLNVFRDQLDRYGEIDTVVKKWGETLKKVGSKIKVFINGDDQNLLDLKKSFKGKIQTFGLEEYAIAGEKVIKQPQKQKLDFSASNIKTSGLSGTKFTIQSVNSSTDFTLPVPGIYHIYNFLAALVVSQNLDVPVQVIKKSLQNFSPAFGRVEKLDFGYIFLIKNPAGATQVLQTLAPQIRKGDRLLIALNDNLADGTDVSWIWDSDFEKLKVKNSKLKVYVSGTRAQDLSLRLKYARFDPKSLIVENDLKKAFNQARKGLKGRLFILPTYTALLELQEILAKQGLKNPYWQEDKS